MRGFLQPIPRPHTCVKRDPLPYPERALPPPSGALAGPARAHACLAPLSKRRFAATTRGGVSATTPKRVARDGVEHRHASGQATASRQRPDELRRLYMVNANDRRRSARPPITVQTTLHPLALLSRLAMITDAHTHTCTHKLSQTRWIPRSLHDPWRPLKYDAAIRRPGANGRDGHRLADRDPRVRRNRSRIGGLRAGRAIRRSNGRCGRRNDRVGGVGRKRHDRRRHVAPRSRVVVVQPTDHVPFRLAGLREASLGACNSTMHPPTRLRASVGTMRPCDPSVLCIGPARKCH